MTDKTRTLSVRLPLEIADNLEKTLKIQGKTLRMMLTEYTDGVLPEEEAVKVGVNTKQPQKQCLEGEKWSEIAQMASFFGTDTDGLLSGIYEGLNDGTLMFRDGKVVGDTGLELDRLYDLCHDLNVDPQEAIDKLVKEMTR